MDYRRMHTGRRWVATLILLQSSGFSLDESSSVQSPKPLIVGAGDRNRTGTGLLSPRDFKSVVKFPFSALSKGYKPNVAECCFVPQHLSNISRNISLEKTQENQSSWS